MVAEHVAHIHPFQTKLCFISCWGFFFLNMASSLSLRKSSVQALGAHASDELVSKFSRRKIPSLGQFGARDQLPDEQHSSRLYFEIKMRGWYF